MMGFLRRGGRRGHDEDFVAYYAARAGHLRNTAYLLCGDWHLAEDLTQTAFTNLYRAWGRIDHHDVLDQYARRVLLRAFLDERRRPWRREHPTVPDDAALDSVAVGEDHLENRQVLKTALLRVPKRRRAVLVLRFWADLSVEQVAEILGCSTGTVKSQTSRGLDDLRNALGGALHDLKTSGGQP
ncbi:SigE family RNA polymerase sigma factor [Dactylosporangium sucinum]|uniref:RNA polymerase sigma24 factor n=1 Tax=Dactylosporangium sucinum TaxID=1424081 RepID=A0A917X5G3_9ACTN|nr:SigE family RNA polymerase sigma factor [Dactylosporangium sucinum]GGM69194.1 RNA polymerase sigma24 factor [Dactylosporangium sucinum]